ncbi:PEP/pyruvate-binding domain-containing protein [Pseudophaeobacter flagellatus]|uniref:PEP/pyruvate-binding domain-containing protein n=1 Tax=Pseudophaeobacter flagellatus TaxID=2899119 RepID=UPI001E5D0B8D|nr:PEP/pyruvate-binding domain-containing protein [Pseudophaeobacter flagellatus]MCD9149677.1 YidC/Oxa1 family membrane protein insertase [Pseudophaeobacter flagellatus]
MMSGLGAVVATKLGFKTKDTGQAARYPARLILTLVALVTLFGAANYWQYTARKNADLARLQATLVRPAQFDGTKIKDDTLKETSFSKQTDNPLAISTQEAAALLAAGDTAFFDIRESGENAMGTLPGAAHIRFPDFLQSRPLQPGQKAVVFCHNGNRSSETCAQLAKLGIDCSFIAGGIEKWIVEGRPFSDTAVETLADLRAIPDYPNKDTLLSTADFTTLLETDDLQIVDTRYPGDFASGHLPGAINIPIRALTTDELRQSIAQLQDKPTLAACYDRRSCFMGQVLGLELSQQGIDYRGRYTLPWEYFIPPPPKPHVQAWLADQQSTYWQKTISLLAQALIWSHERSHLLLGLFALSLLTRILILPVALKSERDQITTQASAKELERLKADLADDPVRRARAIQAFYATKGLTPLRNLSALLFLPVMMLGVSAAGEASSLVPISLLWIPDLGQPDPLLLLPLMFCALAAIYLVWAVAKTARQVKLWLLIGVPVLFAMVFGLSAAANAYLCFSLSLLLLQRAYVTGLHQRLHHGIARGAHQARLARLPAGVVPLGYSEELATAGNKALRLSLLKNAGLPVPGGVVLRHEAIAAYQRMNRSQKDAFAEEIWHLAGTKLCAVRSSASNEDGADQSFAGVYESELDVTAQTMRRALDRVIASFSSDRAASYDQATNGENAANILVQQMVQADYAGVLFTQDPTAPGMTMVEWVRGCGDDLVSGRVTPVSLRFGRCTGLAAVPDQDDTLDLAPLLALGQEIERIFGCPQDVEWAYTDGQFQIVQSRDITTLALGPKVEQIRLDEWRDLLDRFGSADPEQVILEQDEMSEVLPRPTPLSFSLMTRLWAPGGSVDLACRDLGVPYGLPEGGDGHLVNLFGKTYVDAALKQQMTLKLSATKAKQLRRQAEPQIAHFRTKVMSDLADRLQLWQAVDYSALTPQKLVQSLQVLQNLFVDEAYVEAEKINILAGFTMGEASTATAGDPALRTHLMQADLPHAPSALLASCTGVAARDQAMALMGHRAMFDYELSSPRYSEAPALLWPLLENQMPSGTRSAHLPAELPNHLKESISLALRLQDLKEQAKHESLRILAELRRAFQALGQMSGLGDLIFYLTLDEIQQGNWTTPEALHLQAQNRKLHEDMRKRAAPTQVQLTLRDCELLSLGAQIEQEVGALGGTCVAGNGRVTGRAFWLADETSTDPASFDGFQDGDILVCRMINPAWLPYVQRSGAVLSEVGGWLSHMAIVAREKHILMLVACKGLGQIETGARITVDEDGSITQHDDQSRQAANG